MKKIEDALEDMLRMDMVSEKDLADVLDQVRALIRRADPGLDSDIAAAPPTRSGEPFVFEYLERLIASLEARCAGRPPDDRLRQTWQSLIGMMQHMHDVLAHEWRGH